MKILCTEITQFFTNCLHVLSNGITLLVYIPIKINKIGTIIIYNVSEL